MAEETGPAKPAFLLAGMTYAAGKAGSRSLRYFLLRLRRNSGMRLMICPANNMPDSNPAL